MVLKQILGTQQSNQLVVYTTYHLGCDAHKHRQLRSHMRLAPQRRTLYQRYLNPHIFHWHGQLKLKLPDEEEKEGFHPVDMTISTSCRDTREIDGKTAQKELRTHSTIAKRNPMQACGPAENARVLPHIPGMDFTVSGRLSNRSGLYEHSMNKRPNT